MRGSGERALSGLPLPSTPRTILLAETVALPVALAFLAAEPQHWRHVLVSVTIYAQCIGLLCRALLAALWPRLMQTRDEPRPAVVLGVFFLSGVVGSELAGRFWVYYRGHPWQITSHWLNVGIGATTAVMAGLALTTLGQLRWQLEQAGAALRERERREAELLQAKTEAELAALRARIDPHFLFNTLNSIAALIGEDPAKAEAVTWQLSSLFRYALQANRRGLVTLREELEIVRRYLEIEQVRLGSRLAYEIDVDPALVGEPIPALLLQPLVENAIKHGIAPQVGGGFVRLDGRREGDRARLRVRDSGAGAGSAAGTGEGLDNVRQRLDALYGGRASVTLRSAAGETETEVVLPLSPAS